jgi:DNA-binding MarR family transcriptional regulator
MSTTSPADADTLSASGHPAPDGEPGRRTDPLSNASPPSDAERLSRGIMRLMWFDSKRLAQILAGYDLTVPQFFTLMSISRGGSGCRMGDLAHRLFQSSATMTGIVTRLEADGLVERVMDPDDRRAVQVGVTERAKQVLEEVLALQRANVARTLERMSPADRQDFLRLLDVYLDALTDASG